MTMSMRLDKRVAAAIRAVAARGARGGAARAGRRGGPDLPRPGREIDPETSARLLSQPPAPGNVALGGCVFCMRTGTS